MTEQPPVQPSHEQSGPPATDSPQTQPMPAASSVPDAFPVPPAPPATPPAAAKTNVWHQATATRGGRWAVAVAAGALAVLMLLGIGFAGFLVLRHHDSFAMTGQRQGMSRDQSGNGNNGNSMPGRHPGMSDGRSPQQRGMPGAPGLRGGAQGRGGLGSVLAGTLHGSVTAMVNGSAQVLLVQRGEVTAVSATAITLKSSDGFVGTYVRSAMTRANGLDPVKGGQALVLARASDKVALRTLASPVNVGVGPSS